MEMTSKSRHRHNLEILLCKDSSEVKLKFKELYDPAISKLLSAPSVKYDFESRRVKIETPIATEANLGPYSIKVEPVTPMHFSGTIRPETVSATMKADGLDYKYSADMEFKADVDWHPRPWTELETVAETVKKSDLQKQKEYLKPDNSIDWHQLAMKTDKLITVVCLTIMSFIPQVRASSMAGTKTLMPFTHTVRIGNYGYPKEA